MKVSVLLLWFVLLFSPVLSAQKGGRPSRPYKPPSYTPPPRPGDYRNNRTVRDILKTPYPRDLNSQLRRALAKSDKISAEEHIAKWAALRTLSQETLEQIKNEQPEYEVAYENGKYEVLRHGEVMTKYFTFTESKNSITIKTAYLLKKGNIEMIFDESIWKSGKKIYAENIGLKILEKNGQRYNIQRVVTANGELRYMANLKKGIWFDPTRSNAEVILTNLERNFNKESIKVISIVSDFKTNQALKDNFGSMSLICKTKKELLAKIKAQDEGSTLFIVGHHEKGRFVTYDTKGNLSFEFTSAEMKKLRNEKKINIFPLGCKTAFSEFNEGVNIDLNSIELIQSFAWSLGSSNNARELFQNLGQNDPDLRFLIEDDSFGAIKVTVYKDISRKGMAENSFRSDSIVSEQNFVNLIRPIKVSKIGEGVLFTGPGTINSEINIAPDSETDVTLREFSDDSKTGDKINKRRSFFSNALEGFLYLFIIIFIFCFLGKLSSKKTISRSDFLTSIIEAFVGSFALVCLATLVYVTGCT